MNDVDKRVGRFLFFLDVCRPLCIAVARVVDKTNEIEYSNENQWFFNLLFLKHTFCFQKKTL